MTAVGNVDTAALPINCAFIGMNCYMCVIEGIRQIEGVYNGRLLKLGRVS